MVAGRKEKGMSAEDTIRAFLAKRIGRREFIRQLRAIGVTAGAAFSFAEVLSGCQLPASGTSAEATGPRGPVALNESEFKTLEAISGRIVPTTETPGAIEAGAAYYIDQALADPYKPQLPRYRRGLGELDRYCVTKYNVTFVALTEAQQDTLLEELEAGKLKEVEGGSQFFELVRRHVMEGVFCEPYYGGNRDLIGWKLVGFPGQRYGYDDPYINRVIDLPPIAQSGPPRKGN